MKWARTSERDEGFSVIELINGHADLHDLRPSCSRTTLIAFTRATLTAQQTGRTGEQLVVAFGALDSQIRYAESVNYPGPGATAGNVYVEWLTGPRARPPARTSARSGDT